MVLPLISGCIGLAFWVVARGGGGGVSTVSGIRVRPYVLRKHSEKILLGGLMRKGECQTLEV